MFFGLFLSKNSFIASESVLPLEVFQIGNTNISQIGVSTQAAPPQITTTTSAAYATGTCDLHIFEASESYNEPLYMQYVIFQRNSSLPQLINGLTHDLLKAFCRKMRSTKSFIFSEDFRNRFANFDVVD